MSPLLDSNGASLHYDDGGNGPALLLTHGYSATGDMWLPQRRSFQDTYRVVTMDLRGHGRSESPEDPTRYTHALCVADMAALLDHLEIERACHAANLDRPEPFNEVVGAFLAEVATSDEVAAS